MDWLITTNIIASYGLRLGRALHGKIREHAPNDSQNGNSNRFGARSRFHHGVAALIEAAYRDMQARVAAEGG